MIETNLGKSAISGAVIRKNWLGIALSVILTFSTLGDVNGKEKFFNYLKNGVSFSIPETWKTISDEALPGKGYYFSAENSQKNKTGLFSLVTINNEENPVKSILIQQKNMKEESIYQESGIEFTAIEDARFGSMKGAKVQYESIVKGIKVAGTIYAFNCSEKTYLLFFQSGMKDFKENAKVFNLIELTFSCR